MNFGRISLYLFLSVSTASACSLIDLVGSVAALARLLNLDMRLFASEAPAALISLISFFNSLDFAMAARTNDKAENIADEISRNHPKGFVAIRDLTATRKLFVTVVAPRIDD